MLFLVSLKSRSDLSLVKGQGKMKREWSMYTKTKKEARRSVRFDELIDDALLVHANLYIPLLFVISEMQRYRSGGAVPVVIRPWLKTTETADEMFD